MKIKSAMIVIISFIILNFTMLLNVYAVQTTSSTSEKPSSSSSSQSSTSSSSKPPLAESSSKVSSVAPSSAPKPQSQQTPSSEKVETNNYNFAQQNQQTSSQPKQQYTYSSSSLSEASSASSSEEQTSSLNLPEVTSEDISSPRTVTSVTYANSNSSKILGIVACVLIGIGVLIVLIVILSSRKSGRNTFSRKRYGRSGRKKNKHLLADKYYRNIKRR